MCRGNGFRVACTAVTEAVSGSHLRVADVRMIDGTWLFSLSGTLVWHSEELPQTHHFPTFLRSFIQLQDIYLPAIAYSYFKCDSHFNFYGTLITLSQPLSAPDSLNFIYIIQKLIFTADKLQNLIQIYFFIIKLQSVVTIKIEVAILFSFDQFEKYPVVEKL